MKVFLPLATLTFSLFFLLALVMSGCPTYPMNGDPATDERCQQCHVVEETAISPPSSHWEGMDLSLSYDACTACHSGH